ncbi:MAG: type II toxin-antitoxin system RelE/ParE family toxin [Gemmatimonadota bacterium]|nr:MAG: type II toxin-antitoxin system RelE/ParE family toxin [Gemmatimonadota bacterium]
MATSEPRWHPEAVEDAESARDWYAERSPLAARGFLLALREAVAAVAATPERWPVGGHGCRRYVFPTGYPYTLVYRVSTDLEIVAVVHQKRRPGYWAHR